MTSSNKTNAIRYICIGMFIASIILYFYYNYYISKITDAGVKAQILKVRNEQVDLDIALSMLFNQYDIAIHEYLQNPNTQTHDKFTQIGNKLDDKLIQASNTFGLNVKRWADLFRVWQYYTEKKTCYPF